MAGGRCDDLVQRSLDRRVERGGRRLVEPFGQGHAGAKGDLCP